MLSPDRVEQVRRMLAAGELSLREIARRTGVSRGTVSNIAHGRTNPVRRRKTTTADDSPWPEDSPYGRCPTCGALVRIPCLACRVRASMAKATGP